MGSVFVGSCFDIFLPSSGLWYDLVNIHPSTPFYLFIQVKGREKEGGRWNWAFLCHIKTPNLQIQAEASTSGLNWEWAEGTRTATPKILSCFEPTLDFYICSIFIFVLSPFSLFFQEGEFSFPFQPSTVEFIHKHPSQIDKASCRGITELI